MVRGHNQCTDYTPTHSAPRRLGGPSCNQHSLRTEPSDDCTCQQTCFQPWCCRCAGCIAVSADVTSLLCLCAALRCAVLLSGSITSHIASQTGLTVSRCLAPCAVCPSHSGRWVLEWLLRTCSGQRSALGATAVTAWGWVLACIAPVCGGPQTSVWKDACRMPVSACCHVL